MGVEGWLDGYNRSFRLDLCGIGGGVEGIPLVLCPICDGFTVDLCFGECYLLLATWDLCEHVEMARRVPGSEVTFRFPVVLDHVNAQRRAKATTIPAPANARLVL